MNENIYIKNAFIEEKYFDCLSGSYLSNVPAVKYLLEGNALTFDSSVTFIAGENGSGKSTLLEAIAVSYGFNPEGGTINFSFSSCDTHSELHKYLTLGKLMRAKTGFFLRAESFYNVASRVDALDKIAAAAPPIIESYGGISLHEQSHGESFLAAVQNRFGKNGLYILDEPEAALSPMKLLTLLAEIKRIADGRSQFIISTHSPILMHIRMQKYMKSQKMV